ncbi:unnamed protein product [Caenorhabditis angaria]|uniref:Vitellogenin domain-containing protein n=1 Tax=Caenorhabditis angaria TaxID=860376 RepID=A0A9P1NAS6_9PELO|nr:unnamed protein product [Caenorhabditis angaria]
MKLTHAILFLLFTSIYGSRNFLKVGNEYVYRLNSFTYSGLLTSIDTETAKSRIDAIIKIQVHDSENIALFVEDVEISSNVNNQKSNISSDTNLFLLKPVFAKMDQGFIYNLYFNIADTDWSKNFKRSILNMFSIAEQKSVQLLYESFFLNEKTIEGDCQVVYTIKQKNNDTIINKSVNFDECIGRPEIIYGNQNIEKSHPRTDYTFTLNNGLLKRVEFQSIYIHKMKTVTYSRLVHMKTRQIESKFRRVNLSEEPEDLVYLPSYERSVEDFYKNGDDAKINPFKCISIDEKLNILNKTIEKFEKDESHQLVDLMKEIAENAFAIAGTKNTIEYLIFLIHNNKFNSLRSVELLKIIQSTIYPSMRIADSLIELAKSKVSEDSESIQQAAWLASSIVVNGIVTQKYHLLNENTPEMQEKYFDQFLKLIQDSDNSYSRILALKVHANAGLTNSVHLFAQVIDDVREPISVRQEAIESLRNIGDIIPLKIIKLLFSIYRNHKNPTQLRIVALKVIMSTKPTKSMLEKIAKFTETESNQPVKYFTSNLLNQRNITVNCLDCQPYSIESIIQYFAPGVNFNSWILETVYTKIPKQLHLQLKNMEFGFSQKNLDQYLNYFISKYERHILSPEAYERLELLKQFIKFVNNGFESDVFQEPSISGYVRLKSMNFLLVPINREIIGKVLRNFVNNGLNFNEKFDLHKNFAGYFHETERIIPTTSGFPITISEKLPFFSYMQLKMNNSEFDVKLSIRAIDSIEMKMRNVFNTQGVIFNKQLTLDLPLRFSFRFKKLFAHEIHTTLNIPTNYSAEFQLSECSKVFIGEDKNISIISQTNSNTRLEDDEKQIFKIFGMDMITYWSDKRLAIFIDNMNQAIEMRTIVALTHKPFDIQHFITAICRRARENPFNLKVDDLKNFAYEYTASITMTTSVGHKMILKIINHRDSSDKYSLWDIDFHRLYMRYGYKYIVSNLKSSLLITGSTLNMNTKWDSTPQCLPNYLNIYGELDQTSNIKLTTDVLNQLRIVANYRFEETTRNRLGYFFPRFPDWYTIGDNQVHANFTVDPTKRNVGYLTTRNCFTANNFTFQIPIVDLPTISNLKNPICEYTLDKLYTFNEHIFTPPQTTCYSVVTGIDGMFEVSVRKEYKNMDNIIVKVEIVDEEIIYLLKVQDFFSVKKGNKILSITNYAENRIILANNRLIFDIHHCVLEFDGQKLRIKIRPNLLGGYSLNGMCGDIEDQNSNEYFVEKYHNDLKIFAKETEDCDISKNHHTTHTSLDYEEYDMKTFEYRTVVREFAYKTCFSIEAVPFCPKNYIAFDFRREEIKYTCFSRKETRTRGFLNDIKTGTVLEFEDPSISSVEMFSMPLKCVYNS